MSTETKKVRAKFFVSSVNHMQTPGNDPTAQVEMSPVFGSYGDGADNEIWSKYTPSGKIEMTITNPGAIDLFEPGKAYFVDFNPAE
jgi:hypothetical protein